MCIEKKGGCMYRSVLSTGIANFCSFHLRQGHNLEVLFVQSVSYQQTCYVYHADGTKEGSIWPAMILTWNSLWRMTAQGRWITSSGACFCNTRRELRPESVLLCHKLLMKPVGYITAQSVSVKKIRKLNSPHTLLGLEQSHR